MQFHHIVVGILLILILYLNQQDKKKEITINLLQLQVEELKDTIRMLNEYAPN